MLNLKLPNKEIKNGLYLVSTPIGNLSDITLRAIQVLKMSDLILCEDTRVSKNLLAKYEIKSKLVSNHKFNEKKNISKIIDFLKSGKIISMISDAGTPCISDPGAVLVKSCIENSLNVIPIPGPSAVSSAVSVSGFSEKFFFYGFFPEKIKTLNEDFEMLSQLNCSIVFFISSKKIDKNIVYLKKYFSGRKILVCKEMSKYYEEFIRTNVDLLEPSKKSLKGEITIVISEKETGKKSSHKLSESDKINIKKMLRKLSTREVVEFFQQNKKISKREIYNYCIKIKNEN